MPGSPPPPRSSGRARRGWCRSMPPGLDDAAQAGLLRLPGSAPTVAATIAAALKGLKMTAPDYPAYRARVALLAAMIGEGLARP